VGLMVPEMVNAFCDCDPVEAVKFTPVTWAPFTVTCMLAGVKVIPLLLAVTVYDPFARLRKLKLPELSAVVVVLRAPLRLTVAPEPLAAGLMLPDILSGFSCPVAGGGAELPFSERPWQHTIASSMSTTAA